MKTNRDWTVLFIGGASGSGKSSVAYQLGQIYGVNVMEVDDVYQAVKAMTTKETHSAIHYWSGELDWIDVGIEGNVKWLIDVSNEISTGLNTIVENHLESGVPVIIEGDFLNPEFTISFESTKVKAIFINEPDKNQLTNNYLIREGGEPQNYRADISTEYGKWLSDSCMKLGIKVIEARPWDTVVSRIVESI